MEKILVEFFGFPFCSSGTKIFLDAAMTYIWITCKVVTYNLHKDIFVLKRVKNTVTNLGLVKLSLQQWPKIGCGATK